MLILKGKICRNYGTKRPPLRGRNYFNSLFLELCKSHLFLFTGNSKKKMEIVISLKKKKESFTTFSCKMES